MGASKQQEVTGGNDHLHSFRLHGQQRKNGRWDTRTHRQQGDIISLITKVKVDTQRNRQQGYLISIITLKIGRGYVDRHRRLHREQRHIIKSPIHLNKETMLKI
jgi:hypothetical protein